MVIISILICGGAGYIGSHAVLSLLEKNKDVVIIDNFITGHKKAILGGKVYHGDLKDLKFLDTVFKENSFEAVINFAAFSLVSESMKDPFKYYDNNFYGTLNLLKTMKKYNVKNIVFSSTAATYGETKLIPIKETNRTTPTNPYGETKLAIEKMLKWADISLGIKHVILRYFNVAGAHPSGKIGEDHNPESHLIPIILQVALGKHDKIMIFGDDYNTKDGTCIRDYIHVVDLVEAHLLALNYLIKSKIPTSKIYNLGNGEGFSVKEVISVCREVTNHKIPSIIEDRRSGDPAILIASSEKIGKELNWYPKYPSLKQIISDAWKFHQNNPNGYKAHSNK